MYGKQICAEVLWEMSYKQWLGRLRREGYKLLMENSAYIGEGTYCVSGA